MRVKEVYAALSISFLMFANVWTTPAQAQSPQPWPIQLRSHLQRLATVGWRLRIAAAEACTTYAGQTGIAIDHISAYRQRDRAWVKNLIGLSETPQIAAVAPDSPAARAGLLPGDELLSIDGTDWRRYLDRASDREPLSDVLERSLEGTADTEPLTLLIGRGGRSTPITVSPQRLCAARFVLKTGEGLIAYSDDDSIAVSSALVQFTMNDDELALVAGHELGHIIARDTSVRGLGNRRKAEDRADRIGVHLAYCAGYDAEKGLAFHRRYHSRDRLWFLRDPSHRSTPGRIKRMIAYLTSLSPADCPIPAVSR